MIAQTIRCELTPPARALAQFPRSQWWTVEQGFTTAQTSEADLVVTEQPDLLFVHRSYPAWVLTVRVGDGEVHVTRDSPYRPLGEGRYEATLANDVGISRVLHVLLIEWDRSLQAERVEWDKACLTEKGARS